MAPLPQPMARLLAQEGNDVTLCWRLRNTFLDFYLGRGESAPDKHPEDQRRRSKSADATGKRESSPSSNQAWTVCTSSHYANCRSGLSVWCPSPTVCARGLAESTSEDTGLETTSHVSQEEGPSHSEALLATDGSASDEESADAIRRLGGGSGVGGGEDGAPVFGVTTVMLRNIACRYSQEEVASILDEKGLQGKYDLVYLPRSPTRQSNLGYAFVNFTKPEYVEEAKLLLDGQPFGRSRTTKKCQVALAHVQGSVSVSHRLRRKGARKNQAAPLFLGTPDLIAEQAAQ